MVKALVFLSGLNEEPVEVEEPDRDGVVARVYRMAFNPSRRRPRVVRVEFQDNGDVRWLTV